MMQEEKEERRQMNWISPPSSPSVAVILVSSLPSSSSSCLLSCWCHSFLFLSSLSVCLSSLLPDSLHHHQKIWSSLTTKSEGESICIFIIWHRIPLLLPSSLSHSCLIRSWNSYQANTILYNYLVFGEDCVGKGYFFSFPLICSSPGVSAPMIPFSSLLSILLEQKKEKLHTSIHTSLLLFSFLLSFLELPCCSFRSDCFVILMLHTLTLFFFSFSFPFSFIPTLLLAILCCICGFTDDACVFDVLLLLHVFHFVFWVEEKTGERNYSISFQASKQSSNCSCGDEYSFMYDMLFYPHDSLSITKTEQKDDFDVFTKLETQESLVQNVTEKESILKWHPFPF